MISPDLDDLLSLIAATIFADKRVLSSEIASFLRATSELKLARAIDPKLSEARLLYWYEVNKEALKSRMKTQEFESWLHGCLDRLADLDSKDDILEVMERIARSDGELHVSERALIALAKRRWAQWAAL